MSVRSALASKEVESKTINPFRSSISKQNSVDSTKTNIADNPKDSLPSWAAQLIVDSSSDKPTTISAGKTWTDSTGNGLLHLCTAQNKAEYVKVLVEHGFDSNAKNDYGWTPLAIAAVNGFSSLVAYFLELPKTNVAVENSFGFTPLMLATVAGHFKLAEELAERIGSQKVTSTGMTPLMLACFRGNEKGVATLLQKGAECNQQYSLNGWTALMYATCCEVLDKSDFDGEEAIPDLLSRSLSLIKSPLYNQFPHSTRQKSTQSKAAGAGTSATSPSRSLHIIKQLLSSGADILVCNWMGKSALDIAFETEKWDTAYILLKSLDAQRLKHVESLAIYKARYANNAQAQPLMLLLQDTAPALPQTSESVPALIQPHDILAVTEVPSLNSSSNYSKTPISSHSSLVPTSSADYSHVSKQAQRHSERQGSNSSLAQSKVSVKGWMEKLAERIGILNMADDSGKNIQTSSPVEQLPQKSKAEEHSVSAAAIGNRNNEHSVSAAVIGNRNNEHSVSAAAIGNRNNELSVSTTTDKSSYSLGTSALSNIYTLPLDASIPGGGKFSLSKRLMKAPLENSASSNMAQFLSAKVQQSGGNNLSASFNVSATSKECSSKGSTPRDGMLEALEEEASSSAGELKEIRRFLEKCGSEEYTSLFGASNIKTMDELSKLNEGDLIRIGVSSPFHQRQILQALALSRNGGNNSSVKSLLLAKSLSKQSFSLSSSKVLSGVAADPPLNLNCAPNVPSLLAFSSAQFDSSHCDNKFSKIAEAKKKRLQRP